MTSMRQGFREHYGPWALIAGASEGIGAAFATQLARCGLDLILLARRPAPLAVLASELTSQFDITAVPHAMNLAEPDLITSLDPILQGRDVGMLVCNAALASTGPFLDRPIEDHLEALSVNCQAPLRLIHTLGSRMAMRGRGGIVVVSSMAGLQGAPWLATYGAGKAFGRVLAEGLWAEFQGRGVDVLACVAGATSTPGYLATAPHRPMWFAPRVQTPDQVAQHALWRLGHPPCTVSGLGNRIGAGVMTRLLPRAWAIRMMGRATRSVWQANQRQSIR